jgi:hypothetical protein
VAICVATAATGTGYGYVSEAGAPGAPLRGTYRAGILGVAAALALLAAALRPLARDALARDPFVRITTPGSLSLWAGVLALTTAAPLAATSGVVACTPGCPLPPYESPSQVDLVHALASIGGLGFAAVAMMLLAIGPPEAGSRLRLASRLGAGLTVPLLAGAGLAMLIVGRGLVTGALERAALAVALGWLVAAAVTLATTRPPPARSVAGPAPSPATAIRRRT